jgi:hypothetical protein
MCIIYNINVQREHTSMFEIENSIFAVYQLLAKSSKKDLLAWKQWSPTDIFQAGEANQHCATTLQRAAHCAQFHSTLIATKTINTRLPVSNRPNYVTI